MDKNTGSATPRSATPATKRLFHQFCDKQAKALKAKLPFLTSAQINAKVKKKWLSLPSDRKLTTCQELSKYPLRSFIQKNAQDKKGNLGLKRRIFINSAYFRPRISEGFHTGNELRRNAIHGPGKWKAVSTHSDGENRHDSETFDSSKDIKETNQAIEEPKTSTPKLRRSKRLKTRIARTAFKFKKIKESRQELVRKKETKTELKKGTTLSANFKLRRRFVPTSVLQEYEFDDGYNCLSTFRDKWRYQERSPCSRTGSSKNKLLYRMPTEPIKGIETWENIPNEFNKLPARGNLQNNAGNVNILGSSTVIDGSQRELCNEETYQFSERQLHSSNSQGRSTSSRRSHNRLVNDQGNTDIALDFNFGKMSTVHIAKDLSKPPYMCLRNTPKRLAAFQQDVIGKRSGKETHDRGSEITQPAPGRSSSQNNLPMRSEDAEEPSSNDLSSPDESITGRECLSDHSSDSSQGKDAVFITRSEYNTNNDTEHLSDFSAADNGEEAKHDTTVFCDTTFSPDHYVDILDNCQNTTPQLVTRDGTLEREEVNVTEPTLQNSSIALKNKKLSCTADVDRLEIQNWAILTKSIANGKEMTSDDNHEYDLHTLQSDDLLCDMFKNVIPGHGQSEKRCFSRVLGSTGKAFNTTSFNRLFNEENIFL